MSDCKKCDHKLLYAIVHVAEESGQTAQVKMREGFYLDTSGGLMRIAPSGKYLLAFSVLKAILVTENRAVFYFVNGADKDAFLMAYPEYTTWNL